MQELRDAGYLPAAVRNYLALLGWGTTDDATLLSTDELVERFELGKVGRSSAVFDEAKLRWMNGRYMRELDPSEYEQRLSEYLAANEPQALAAFTSAEPQRRRIASEVVQEKAQTMAEVWPLVGFLFGEPETDPAAWEKRMTVQARPLLERRCPRLRDLDRFDVDSIETALRGVLEREGVKPKQLFQPLRVALTGGTVSPGIFETLAALGRSRRSPASRPRSKSLLEG